MKIDLRSDTVTIPTASMRAAMMDAKIGDDVYGEDESVNELQQFAAAMFGKEAALFCPSGTMTNQISIQVHTRPGDELLCAEDSHVYKYEGGGIASNSGVQAKLLKGNFGRLTAQQIEEAINADDVHFPNTSLVSLENTFNRGGGSCYELNDLKAIQVVCAKHALNLHLDGARIFNAMVAKKQSAIEIGNAFDSLSICLSKGLGAPVGSLLLGSQQFILKAKRVRKVFGGGMRQAGFLAAAGLYALQNNIKRLSDDHNHAQITALEIQRLPKVKSIMPVETNIVIVQFDTPVEADAFHKYLTSNDVICNKISSNSIRLVFHLDITPNMVDKLLSVIKKFHG